MAIHISKNGQNYGPYNEADVAGYLRSGQFDGNDFAWREGCAGWIPLRQLMGMPAVTPQVPVPVRHPVTGIISFVVGLLGIPYWIILLAFAAAATSKGKGDQDPTMIVTGLLVFFGVAVNFVAGILGIVAAARRGPRKALSVVGILLNGAQFLGLLAILVVGVSMKDN